MRIACQIKNPENKKRFRGMNPHRDHTVLSFTFFYPDYTVGLGITPGHARSARGLYHRSRIHLHYHCVLCSAGVTLPRRLLSCKRIITQIVWALCCCVHMCYFNCAFIFSAVSRYAASFSRSFTTNAAGALFAKSPPSKFSSRWI